MTLGTHYSRKEQYLRCVGANSSYGVAWSKNFLFAATKHAHVICNHCHHLTFNTRCQRALSVSRGAGQPNTKFTGD
jgi:hypothetical protein